MKNRTNRLLFLGFVLSLAAHILLFLMYADVIPLPFPWDWYTAVTVLAYLALGFGAVPAFCLQLLLCRLERWKVLKALPLVLVLGCVLVCGVHFLTATGWGSLGWGILLICCIAPAVGCILALAFHHLRKSFQ